MKILHQVGHNANRNLDSYYENSIGAGFILCAYNIDNNSIGSKISKYKFSDIVDKTLLDLQFYGDQASQGGKLDSYPFHPINNSHTLGSSIDPIIQGVQYQIRKGFDKIIIPHAYYDIIPLDKLTQIIFSTNKKLEEIKMTDISFQGKEYFMTLPICNAVLEDEKELDKLLLNLTKMEINFDGYYIVCDEDIGTRKKVSDNYNYYYSLSKIFKILKGGGFKTIFGYANFDAIIFASVCDIDYITIGTYENLRNFNIEKFTENQRGGPSDGRYFSETLLNMIKANEIEQIRRKGGISTIQNKSNIFSDTILAIGYKWNTHKPDIHKNYLLSISKMLESITKIEDLKDRKQYVIKLIEEAMENYSILESKGIFLTYESSNYHLGTWLSFLKGFK